MRVLYIAVSFRRLGHCFIGALHHALELGIRIKSAVEGSEKSSSRKEVNYPRVICPAST